MDFPLLKLQNLSIGYIDCKPLKVVHDSINLSLNRGELTCLLGMNGAGKSTLLKTLGGFQPQLCGEIMLEGKELHHYARKELAKKLGVVLTDRIASGNLSVYELISFGRYVYTGFFGTMSSKDHKAVREAMDCVGISAFGHRNISELSDGERQKVMIAKAIAQETNLILLDEPTAFLDLSSRVEIMLLLRKLASEQGKTVLLSTHDLDLALQLSDKLWLMAKKQDMVCGVPEDLAQSGILNAFFDKESLAFDVSSGIFKIKLESTKKVSVEMGESDKIWIEKALLRKGYQLSDSELLPHISKRGEMFLVKIAHGETEAATIEAVLQTLASNE